MTRLLRSVVLIAFAASFLAAPGCRTKQMPVEAEALAGLPLLPYGVLPTWDERSGLDKVHTVPRDRFIEDENLGWTFLEALSTFIPLFMPRWDAREVEAGGWWEKRPGLWKGTNPDRGEKESERSTHSKRQ